MTESPPERSVGDVGQVLGLLLLGLAAGWAARGCVRDYHHAQHDQMIHEERAARLVLERERQRYLTLAADCERREIDRINADRADRGESAEAR